MMTIAELRSELLPHVGLTWSDEYVATYVLPIMIRWMEENKSDRTIEECLTVWDNIIVELLIAHRAKHLH